jgi:hypothetical protein
MRASPRRGRPPGQEADEEAAPTPTGGSPVFSEATREARKLAAAILEVLAGATTPTDAARAVGVSLARYYQLEVRAMAGLVAACEDRRRRGRRGGPGSELIALRREVVQLRRECARQQALVRAARRAIGLTPPPSAPPENPPPRRRGRRPTARALKMAALLQVEDETVAAAVSPAGTTEPGQPPEVAAP